MPERRAVTPGQLDRGASYPWRHAEVRGRPLLQIGADAERTLSRGCQHHRADLAVSRDLRADLRQPDRHGRVQRIHRLRPVEHDLADHAADFTRLMPMHPDAAY